VTLWRGSQNADPIKALADSLREKKGVVWSTAKLETPDGEGTYVEYFRGKDFARYFRANPEKLNLYVPPKPGSSCQGEGKDNRRRCSTRLPGVHCTGKTVEDQIADLMLIFMKRKLVRKTDRKYKKPKPGKKRLVKFPRTLVPHPVRLGRCELLHARVLASLRLLLI
jgi:translocation protein SEC62